MATLVTVKDSSPAPLPLLEQVRRRVRAKHLSRRTEQAYTHWVKRFILFHQKRHPAGMAAPEVEAFLPSLDKVTRAKPRERRPVVLSHQEVSSLLAHMSGVTGLMARLIYGTGMRLMECCQLRVKEVDFHQREITIRAGKGGKDRVTMLPVSLVPDLQAQQRAWGLPARSTGTQIPGCCQQLGVVLVLSCRSSLRRPGQRHSAQASPV